MFGSSTTNPYLSKQSGIFGNNSNGGNDASSMFPALVNLINNTKSMANINQQDIGPTPLEEIQQILLSLPIEQRQVVENSPEYLELKSIMFQEFIVWSIACTELGRAYILGPGAHKAKKLLEITKDLSSSASKVATSKIQELENALLMQQELFKKQSEEFAKFKAQFEDPAPKNS